MNLVYKLYALRSLPCKDMGDKIYQGIRKRAVFLTRWVFYSTIGRLINGSPCPFLIGYKPDSHFHSEQIRDFPALFKRWTADNRANNGGDLSRFYMLYQNVEHVLAHAVQGDLVEVGVYKGNSAAVLAELARRFDRSLYLFDTFCGFDDRDLTENIVDSKRPFADTSLEAVQRLVGDHKVKYVKGYFPDSARGIELPRTVAVLHLDCDLYAPTKQGLEYFYSLVAPGGIIVMHDYSSGCWPGVTQAIDEFFNARPEKPILIPDKSGSAVIRKQWSKEVSSDGYTSE
jgi:Macrocin-O-methyltransferase (TylF)